MKYYFFYLDIWQTIVLCVAGKLLYPSMHNAGLLGMFIGFLCTVMVFILDYKKDSTPHKSRAWLMAYFQKDYVIEVLAMAAFVAACFLLSRFGFLMPLWHFLLGFGLLLLSNILFECVWRYTIYIYVKRKYLDDDSNE